MLKFFIVYKFILGSEEFLSKKTGEEQQNPASLSIRTKKNADEIL